MPVTLARGPCQPRWWRSRTVFEESHLARNLTGAEVCHRHREGSFDPGISVKRKLNPSWPAGPAKNLAKTKTSSPFSTATGFLRSSSRARSFRVRYSRRFLAVCSRETNLGRRIFPHRDWALLFDSRPGVERQLRVRITGKPGQRQVTKIVREPRGWQVIPAACPHRHGDASPGLRYGLQFSTSFERVDAHYCESREAPHFHGNSSRIQV